jgi:hypothetical protein
MHSGLSTETESNRTNGRLDRGTGEIKNTVTRSEKAKAQYLNLPWFNRRLGSDYHSRAPLIQPQIPHTPILQFEERWAARWRASGWRRRQLARRSKKAEKMERTGWGETGGNPRTLFFIHRWVARQKYLPGFRCAPKFPFHLFLCIEKIFFELSQTGHSWLARQCTAGLDGSN